MMLRYSDTDTLYVELQTHDVVGTRQLDENTVADVDLAGNICAVSFEQASRRAELGKLLVSGLQVQTAEDSYTF